MQADLASIVTVLGSWLALWFFINMIVPIRRFGIRSRKVAFILLVVTIIIASAANARRQQGNVETTAEQQPKSAVAVANAVTPPKDDGSNNILAMAKDKERQEIWIIKGQDAVQEKLKDPSSATFRKAFFHLAKLNGAFAPITCGQVNSKNSLGGYVGYQRYISAGTPELTFLEEEVADFNNAWKLMCLD
jgi:hypothetical protein